MSFSFNSKHEAKLHYESGDYKIISAGEYVLCSVTGKKIFIDELKYWNYKRQEAYANCQISYERELECNCDLYALYLKKKKISKTD